MYSIKRKLDETKFFLDLLPTQTEQEIFEYYLSAFLTACRSVTLIMEEQSNHIQDFEQMKREYQSDSLMEYMRKKRNIFVHKRPLQTKGHTNVSFSDSVTMIASVISIELVDEDDQVDINNLLARFFCSSVTFLIGSRG